MPGEAVVISLLRIAAEDLAGARALSAIGNRNAVYLCEQAAEKVIRPVLTAEGKHAGITHRLNEMVDAVADGNALKPALRAIQELTPCATSFRYPTPVGRIPTTPKADELAAMIAKVNLALSAAALALGVDVGGTAPKR